MTFKLLNFTLNIGKFWGIILNVNEKKTGKIRKIVIFLIHLLFTIYVLVAIYLKRKSTFYAPVVQVMAIVLDLGLFTIYFYAMIINFCKEKEWNQLIKSLKLVQELTKMKENNHLFGFNVLFFGDLFGIVIIIYSHWIQAGPRIFWLHRFTVVLQCCFTTYVTYLLLLIAHMLLRRYQALKVFIDSIRTNRCYGTSLLKKTLYIAYSLKTTVQLYNQLFGLLLLCICVFTAFAMLGYLQVFLLIDSGHTTTYLLVFTFVGFSLIFVSWYYII